MRILSPPVVLICAFLALPERSAAQTPHVARLQAAAVACVGEVLSGVDSVRVDADERAPFLRPALVAWWRSSGTRAFLIDSTATAPSMSTFRYRVDEASVVLRKASSNLVARTALVAMRYSLVDGDGQISADEFCSEARTDTLDVRAVNALVDPRFPETDVTYERRSLLRRILEPAVIIGATVIGTYLFFNLRSKRTEGG